MKNKAIHQKLTFLEELLSSVYDEVFPGFRIETKRYFRTLRLWLESRGARDMVSRAKRVKHACLNAMLDQPDPEYSFLATRKGWPKAALGFRKFSKTSEGRRAVLTALSAYRDLIVPGDPDFESITRPGVPVSPIYDSIAELAKPIQLADHPRYHFTSKSGPNGVAIRTATLDALALREDSVLDRTLKEFLELQACESVSLDLRQTQSVVSYDRPTYHSRLSLKQEPGGKVRVFAICDYYSQIALKPLHKAVARLLSWLPQDFTWNQEKIKDWVQDRKAEGIHSFHSIDLSSATDRFPAILQKKVVAKLIGIRFSELWYDLMTNRDFIFRKKKVRYSVGQPMGAYSSWPVFAFSHHLVVRYCAKTLGIRDPKYCIVGDDIVIADDRLAEKYREILDQLGVPISKSKSLTGNCLEFCKRIWDSTQEITPLPVKLLLRSRNDHRVLIQLNEWLHTRGVPGSIRDMLLTKLLPTHEGKRKSVVIALTAPIARCRWEGAPIREDWRWPSISIDLVKKIYRDAKVEDLSKVYDEQNKLVTEWLTFQDSQIQGVPGISSGESEFLPTQRVLGLLRELVDQTWSLLDSFQEDLESYLTEPIPKAKSFDPQVLQPDYKAIRLKEMKFLSRVFDLCVAHVEQPDQADRPVLDLSRQQEIKKLINVVEMGSAGGVTDSIDWSAIFKKKKAD